MNKIIRISVDDIIIDPAAQSEMLTTAARKRKPRMRVTGLCEVNGCVLVAMDECGGGCPPSYVFAPFDSLNVDEVTAEISARYFAGFSLVGGFDVKSVKWALFATEK